MRSVPLVIALLITALSIYYSCTDDVTETPEWYEEVRISDEITDWADQAEYFVVFDTAQLYDLIDGGDEFYISKGLVNGFTQRLLKNSGTICDPFIFNFGTVQNATTTFMAQSNNITTPVLLSGYSDSTVIGDEFGGGAKIYAHFDRYELELSLMGYTDIELLKEDAALFLQVYESKIESIR